MVIGVFRLTFIELDPSSRSGTSRQIRDRLTSRFKVSIAQVKSASENEIAFGGSVVSSNKELNSKRIQEILSFCRNWSAVELINEEIETIVFDDIAIEQEMEKYDP